MYFDSERGKSSRGWPVATMRMKRTPALSASIRSTTPECVRVHIQPGGSESGHPAVRRLVTGKMLHGSVWNSKHRSTRRMVSGNQDPLQRPPVQNSDSDADVQVWGSTSHGFIHRKQESDRWSYSPLSSDGSCPGSDTWKDWTASQPRRVEIMPFGLARQEWVPPPRVTTASHSFRLMGRGHEDRLSNSVILDATINPISDRLRRTPQYSISPPSRRSIRSNVRSLSRVRRSSGSVRS